MLPLFRPKARPTELKAAPSHTRRPRRHQLGLEALEGRQLLSIGAELAGNASVLGTQVLPASASAPDGRSVLVWVDRGTSSSSNERIEYRVFDKNGNAVTSDKIVPASGGDVDTPAVAVDHNGNFVIAWTQFVSGRENNILAQRFNPAGNAVGNTVFVATTSRDESNPDVAMDRDGDFVIAFQRFDPATGSSDVLAKQYTHDGNFFGSLDTQSGSQFPSFNDVNPSVAMAADGRIALAYEFNVNGNGANSQIFALTYQADTHGEFHSAVTVAGSGADEQDPDVAMRDNGEFTVAYEKGPFGDRNIVAQRVSFNGTLFGEILIAGQSNRDEADPQIVMSRNGFGFVVAYDSFGSDGSRVGVTEVTGDNSVNTLQLPAAALSGTINPALSLGPDGQYQLVYQRTVGSDTNIFRRRGSGPK
jgi:hypothetical protein